MTRRLVAALGGLALLTFVVVWAVVHYSFIYISGRGFAMIEMVQKPVTVPVGDAERIDMTLHMVYGDLRLEPGTEALLAGSTRYNVAEFAPRLLYEVDGNRGQLQMDHLMRADNTRLINRTGRVSEWQLAINDHVPIEELEVVVGLGNGHIDLRGIDLRHGTLSLLAGDFTVDLRGAWAQNSAVEIEGVTGTITVLLPSETGTLVMVDGGPSTFQVTGLVEMSAPPSSELAAPEPGEDDQNNVYYANSTYEQSATTLHVQVSHGFGTVNLIAEP